MKKIGMTKPHTNWLKKTGAKVQTVDGVAVAVYELTIDHADSPTLAAWAKHFREHYCLDSQIDRLRRGTRKSREQYLLDLVFPDKSEDFGPATRSGDFAEILIADLLDSQMGFWIPRTRYDDKLVRNESPKGTDVLGFKFGGARQQFRQELLRDAAAGVGYVQDDRQFLHSMASLCVCCPHFTRTPPGWKFFLRYPFFVLTAPQYRSIL